MFRTQIGVTVDLDQVRPENSTGLESALVEQNQVLLFQGTVEHGYGLQAVGNPAQCPRCEAPASQHAAYFIYATDLGSRVMLAPLLLGISAPLAPR